MQQRCKNFIFWICPCDLCKEKKKIQLCINCFFRYTERKKIIQKVEMEISELTKIKSHKQLITNENLLKVYRVLNLNNVALKSLSKETIENVRYMEIFYGVNMNENRLHVNESGEIPGNQQANVFYTDSSFLFNI
ncbi:unnamed protein product [Brachionus calyciflorus]|uniref:Uncharacterized protein n=1 Tax=Brachionus calyciflorus TaxID=104777 RepID=A0A814B7R4_9BILA|nr:unnamed protein product [Brachionus calyciflorus]